MPKSTGPRESLRDVESTLAEYVDRGEIPGLTWLIEHDGVAKVGVYGRQSIGGPDVRSDSIFRIASMTKPVTAVAALMLIDDGIISLDQPVDFWLPELDSPVVLRSIESPLDDTVPAKRPIIIEDLLTYRAGMGLILAPPGTHPVQRAADDRGVGVGPPNPATPPPPDEWMRRLGELPLIHQPGEGWMYHTGSDILGVLISRVTGQPLETFMAERIFKPLGMVDTSFHVPPEKLHRLVTNYRLIPETDQLEISDPAENGQWSQPPQFPSGGGGLVSTIDDLARFARMLLTGGTQDGYRLLSEASANAMTTNHLTDEQREQGSVILGDGNGWGYGLAVRVAASELPGSIGSYGWNGGLGTTWLSDQKHGLTAILLTQVNWTSASMPPVVLDFLRSTLDAVADSSGTA